MRAPRIKISDAEAVYHCISRTVNGERILDDTAKEILRRQLWQIADYCGVTILTYAIMDNHFHVLVHIPQPAPVSDAELIRRHQVLYPKPTRFQTATAGDIATLLKNGGSSADAWRKRQLALMGDVSAFMKLLKQRFSIWFNKTHARYGTLWAERFKSVLVEPAGRVIQTIAAYIDLNPVRAGIVADPKDYRFCGYGEAVSGGKKAQSGLLRAIAGPRSRAWTTIRDDYRQMLIGSGSAPRANKAAVTEQLLRDTVREQGKLPVSAVLKCRLRYFTDGAVLGTKAYVAQQLALYRRKNHRRRRTAPRALPPLCDWLGNDDGELVTLRGLRQTAPGQ